MSFYTATGKCISHSRYHDWGRYGQIQTMGNIEASDEFDARKKAQQIFPGGWIITAIEKQDHCHDGRCGCRSPQGEKDD